MARGQGCTDTKQSATRGSLAGPSSTLLPKRPAEAAALVAAARERLDLAQIAACRDELAGLAECDSLYVGGLSVYRLQQGQLGNATYSSTCSGLLHWGDPGYALHLHPDEDPVELLQAQRANPLWRQRHQRNLRLAFQNGMLGIRKDAATWAFIEQAVAANETNERYRQLRAAFHELDDLVVAVSSENSDRRLNRLVTDILTTASWQGCYTALNAEVVKVGLQLQAKGSSGFTDYHPEGKRAPAPGDSSSGDSGGLTATLRHEYAHGIWERLSAGEQDAFIALLPTDEQDIHDGLTHYAALVNVREYDPDRERNYGNGVRGGYRTETFAELVAVCTHPDFDEALFPAWVQDANGFLQELVARRLDDAH
jgi:hypothetical protein